MTERQQRLRVWGGIAFAPIFLIGFALVAGFFPPPSPGMSAEAVARTFAEGHAGSEPASGSLAPQRRCWRSSSRR
jgi:hypothetical protein